MKSLKVAMFSCLLLLATTAVAQEEGMFGVKPTVSYSGLRELVTSEGTITMKEYHAPQKQRIEMDGPTGPVIMINRSDKQLAWMIMPSMNMYMKIPGTQFDQQTGGDVKVVEHSKVGSETIDGHKVDKYKSEFEDAEGNKGGGYYWLTKDNIPLKMDMVFKDGEEKHHIKMQLKELEVAPQADSLFEIPEGYSAMPDMGGKMFPSGMTSPDTTSSESASSTEPPATPSLKSLFKKVF
jgi:hypothetical protein